MDLYLVHGEAARPYVGDADIEIEGTKVDGVYRLCGVEPASWEDEAGDAVSGMRLILAKVA